LLEKMASDRDPRNYTYDEAVTVLRGLGFELAPHGAGSHRAWRCKSPSGTVTVVGLVDKGRGTLKPYLVREMVKQLRANGLLGRSK
jgi:predicted RNA binding protein YcfA (HicA-like mRNA interferase family)